jgi:glycosyltransferase involved in cell wall biosynthesis
MLLTADVFVLPSLHESSPNALIEAMGIGMPCIASDVGGIVDLIEDGKNGIRVPTQDPAALATALHQVLTEPDFASELGKNARTTIQQKFDSDVSIRKLEEIYVGVISE